MLILRRSSPERIPYALLTFVTLHRPAEGSQLWQASDERRMGDALVLG